MDEKVLNAMSYGVYVLTSSLNGQDNGCIVNSAFQITVQPLQVCIAVNKTSLTCDFISKSKKFTLSILNIYSDFSIFKQFGYQSGIVVDKFKDFNQTKRLENGTLAITKGTNGYLCGEVISECDCGTHKLFTAKIIEAVKLNSIPSATYEFYQRKIRAMQNIPQSVGKYAGTQTEHNLWKAFTAESRARNKYTYFASVAKNAGFEQIAAFFQKTADNEKEHAELWFKALGNIGDTKKNLFDAAEDEHIEWLQMYSNYSRIAQEEGFCELAAQFMGVAEIEKNHEERFRRLLKNLRTDRIFEKSGLVIWECRNCGHIFVGSAVPEECPICHHPKGYFELHADNY